MAIRTANPDLHARILSANGRVAAGIRLKQPVLEQDARQDLALAQVENAILLHSDFLTSEHRAFLAHLLMAVNDTPNPVAVRNTTKHNEAARTLRKAKTPADLVSVPSAPVSDPDLELLEDYDPEMEFEDEEEGYEEADYDL